MPFPCSNKFPVGQRGQHCSCAVQNTGPAASPFLYKPPPSNPQTGKGWRIGQKPQHARDFVIVTWKTKKKKRHKRKLMSDPGRSSSPLLCACCTAIFPSLFFPVIKGYSEPLKMPSTLIENEIEHISIEDFTAVIIATCWPEQGAFTDKDGF